jgi:hypothetical protein
MGNTVAGLVLKTIVKLFDPHFASFLRKKCPRFGDIALTRQKLDILPLKIECKIEKFKSAPNGQYII